MKEVWEPTVVKGVRNEVTVENSVDNCKHRISTGAWCNPTSAVDIARSV